ncbi:MAG: hypothetical protein AAGC55_23735, partial [Myxococcota bacterium]
MELVFEAPTEAALSPLEEAIAEITLLRSERGSALVPVQTEIVERGRAIDMGAIEPGADLRLAVELRSATQRLVGFGQSDLLDIAGDDSMEVRIHLRRPLVYLSGASGLVAFDATREASDPGYRSAIEGFAQPLAVAATPDGTAVAVVSASGESWSLGMLATRDHSVVTQRPFDLALPPSDLAVSDDGRFAAVAHGGEGGGVSIVDLQAEGAAVTFVELGPVSRVVTAGSRAVAVVGGGGCAEPRPSQVMAIELASPAQTELVGESPTPRVDLVARGDGAVIAAAPCDDQLILLSAGRREPFAELTAASAVALSGDRVWGVGTRVGDGASAPGRGLVMLARSAQDGADSEVRLELAPSQVLVRTPDLSDPGDEASRQLAADALIAYDLAVLPGGDFVALLVRGDFFAEAQ